MNDSNGKIKSRDSKIIWGLIGVLILILTNFATYIIGTTMPIKGTRRISEATYEDLVKFNKLFIVKENLYKFYDGKIDEEALVDGAIKGMTESLKDPYTVYMNTEEFKEFNTQTEGNYVGLGLQVGVKDDKVVVIAPFEDSQQRRQEY